MSVRILVGDCRELLRTLPDCSVDSVVTDPPYGLTSARPSGRSDRTKGAVMAGFMGLKWDCDVPSTEVWEECLRVLKPGGYLLAFAGTRTQHRMCCRIEDAGFEIRDMIAWLYGSGFPKSHNGPWGGTALKPAMEPITVARKPLIGTVAANYAAHGVGGLNIDGCRVGAEATTREKAAGANQFPHEDDSWEPRAVTVGSDLGRWPANVIHDGSDEVVETFPDAPGQIADASSSSSSRKTQNVYGAMKRGNGREGEESADSANNGCVGFRMRPGARRSDSGSAARFFYCAKASRADRDAGCAEFELRKVHGPSGDGRCWDIPGSNSTARRNNHPTVKPTDLMRYLCRLVTPAGGLVLDPFMGSGSTGRGAILEGLQFIGCELDPGYVAIAEARIADAERERRAANAQADMFAEVAA